MGELAPAIAVIGLAMAASIAVIARGPIGRAIARRIEGPAAADDGRLAGLEQRVAELEAAQQRILELEERVDFAERLITGGAAGQPRELRS